MNINQREEYLILLLRNFEFIKELGYKEYRFLYYVNAYPSVHFKNSKINQILSIIGSDFGSIEPEYSIIIERRRVFSTKVIDISNYYKYFNCGLTKGKNYSLKTLTDFIQQFLKPILNGDIWIDELIRCNKY